VVGSKSIATVAFAAIALVAAASAGLLSPAYLHQLTGTSCFSIGVFASLSTALVALGWRPSTPSRAAIELRAGRPALIEPATPPRELPGAVQQALLALTFACLGLSAFTNEASAQLVAVPSAMGNASSSEYCPEVDEETSLEPAEAPEPEPVDIQGCALIKRAFELGYAKSLGSCAPKAAPVIQVPAKERTLCTLRQRDEPVLHYNWRKLTASGSSLADVDPGAAVGAAVSDFEIRLGYLDTVLAAQSHAITATPHASHHLFTNLPDPDSAGALGRLLAQQTCHARYADLPLGVRSSATRIGPSQVLEQAFGQLLFDSRFGATPGNCREYAIHWGVGTDTCERLRRDPAGTLAEYDALEPIQDVLDRVRRHRELRRLAGELDVRPLIEPPPAPRQVVSLQCFMVEAGGDGAVAGTEIALGGDQVAVREVRVASVATSGAEQLAIYAQLAGLLAGGTYSGPALEDPLDRLAAREPTPDDLAGEGYTLTRLEQLREADPFLGVTWPLGHDELAEVYPLRRHLQAFIDAFRFRYWAQRGRL
jgi:hypothetical protein